MQLSDDLHAHATTIRGFFLRILEDSIGRPDTLDTCAYACILLAESLDKFFPVATTIRGGDGLQDGGYWDGQDVGRGHYWIEVASKVDPRQRWVIDITADQFGGEAVVMLEVKESAARYRPGSQHLVDEGIAEVRESISA